jgi:DNA polymerase-3 subunit alpha/error-prone DNA polymerase
MYFGTWIDAEGESLTQLIFLIACRNILSRWRLLFAIGTVEVDYHFPTITISKMAKMPFIPDPRYSTDRQYKAHQQIKEDVSMTHRAYPQEVNLPRYKMS